MNKAFPLKTSATSFVNVVDKISLNSKTFPILFLIISKLSSGRFAPRYNITSLPPVC